MARRRIAVIAAEVRLTLSILLVLLFVPSYTTVPPGPRLKTSGRMAVRSVALQYLDGQTITEPLLNHLEVAIRAYDPCLSCATHALGQMPLSVTLRDAKGEVLDHVLRSSSGETQRGATPHPMERAQ